MSTLYSTYVCSGCNTTFPVAQRCPKCAPLTEERVREITREEILRAVETHDADAEIRRQARDEALEEAAVWFLNCKTDTVCEGEAGEWIAEKISALKSQPAPAQPSAEKPDPENAALRNAALRKERDSLREKLAEANEDRNRLLQMLKDEQQRVRDLKDGRAEADREYKALYEKLAAADKGK